MINLTPPSLSTRLYIGITERQEEVPHPSDPAMLERLQSLAPVPFSGLAVGRQVHGTAIVHVRQAPPFSLHPETDGLVTQLPACALAIATADCTPVILFDPVTGTLGAAHAGWRGTYEGIVPRLLERFLSLGAVPSDCHALLGPAISGPCYEVSLDLAEMFRTGLPSTRTAFTPGTNGKPRLDLRMAQRIQLREGGLSDDRIATAEWCTHCEPDRFFSYRRDGRLAGRHLTIAVLF